MVFLTSFKGNNDAFDGLLGGRNPLNPNGGVRRGTSSDCPSRSSGKSQLVGPLDTLNR